MAGGIFKNQPFVFNLKCVVFASVLIIAYWTAPKQNVYMLPIIFIVSYVGMAWYDYLYDCEQKLYSGQGYGASLLSSIFKPQSRSKKMIDDTYSLANNEPELSSGVQQKLDDERQQYIYTRNVYLFHIITVAPILLYTGYYGAKTDERVYPVLLSIGVIALLYHGMRLSAHK